MARKKVNLTYIANDAVRRATFRKRRKGLIKKISELSTLCDVPACIVVYGPNEAQPEVWPSEEEARSMLVRFRALPEMEQSKKMVNQEQFLHQRVRKLMDQFKKQERDMREIQLAVIMYECMDGRTLDDMGAEEVTALHYFIAMRTKALYEVTAAAARVVEENINDQAAAAVVAAQNEVVVAPPPPPAVEELLQANWAYTPEMYLPMINEQMFGGMNNGGGGGGASSSGGGYLDNIGGSSWINDPNLFNF